MAQVHLIGERLGDRCKGRIVFVHGLGGHWRETWTLRASGRDVAFWPKELGSHFPYAEVYCVEYNSAVHGEGLGPSDAATAVLDYIAASEEDLCSRPVVLIAHSMGGIVVKEMMTQSSRIPSADRADRDLRRKAAFAGAVVGVMFLATPHQGSSWANVLAYFFKFMASDALASLKADHSTLTAWHEAFRHVAAGNDVRLKSMVETRKMFRGFFPALIVSRRRAAAPGIDEVIPVSADHSEISKPGHAASQVFHSARAFVAARLAPGAEGLAPAADAVSSWGDPELERKTQYGTMVYTVCFVVLAFLGIWARFEACVGQTSSGADSDAPGQTSVADGIDPSHQKLDSRASALETGEESQEETRVCPDGAWAEKIQSLVDRQEFSEAYAQAIEADRKCGCRELADEDKPLPLGCENVLPLLGELSVRTKNFDTAFEVAQLDVWMCRKDGTVHCLTDTGALRRKLRAAHQFEPSTELLADVERHRICRSLYDKDVDDETCSSVSAVAFADLNDDGSPELLVAGSAMYQGSSGAHLHLFTGSEGTRRLIASLSYLRETLIGGMASELVVEESKNNKWRQFSHQSTLYTWNNAKMHYVHRE